MLKLNILGGLYSDPILELRKLKIRTEKCLKPNYVSKVKEEEKKGLEIVRKVLSRKALDIFFGHF